MFTSEDVLEKRSFTGALQLISDHSPHKFQLSSVFGTYQEARQKGDGQSLELFLL